MTKIEILALRARTPRTHPQSSSQHAYIDDATYASTPFEQPIESCAPHDVASHILIPTSQLLLLLVLSLERIVFDVHANERYILLNIFECTAQRVSSYENRSRFSTWRIVPQLDVDFFPSYDERSLWHTLRNTSEQNTPQRAPHEYYDTQLPLDASCRESVCVHDIHETLFVLFVQRSNFGRDRL